VDDEQNPFTWSDHRIDKRIEIFAMGGEAIGIGSRILQFAGIAHADQVRRDQPAATVEFGHHVAPKIGRCRIAVEKQHRRADTPLVIGHSAIQDIDERLGEWLFGHGFQPL